MKRSTPLQRRTRMRARCWLTRRWIPRTKRRARAGEDPAYLARVRLLVCVARYLSACHGRIEAHHAGRRPGIGRKAHDHTAVPLCSAHHTDWHQAAGAFRGWQRDRRREWADEQIAATRALLTGAVGERGREIGPSIPAREA